MAKPRKKRQRKKPRRREASAKPESSREASSPSSPRSSVSASGTSSGGGVLQSMRSGFKRAAGVEGGDKPPSKWSNVFWGALFIAALVLLYYRWMS